VRVRAVLVACCLLVVGAAGPTGCRRSGGGTAVAGTTTHAITVDGQRRTFRLYRPAKLPTGTPVPLVVMLHGALGTGAQAESAYGWDAEADRGGFLVAYPDGLNRAWAVSDTCCGPPAASGVDDVAFITRMVKAVSGWTPVDADRIYATGISNGGMLAYRLACDTTIFAAIGPDSATLSGDCPSPAPVSVLHLHGTADTTIPFAGGPGRRDNGGQGRVPVAINGQPVPELMATWRAVDHCAPPTARTDGPVTTTTATCPDNRAVELIAIAGAGHQWPGSKPPAPVAQRVLHLDPPSTALNATATLWTFFTTHPKHR
jgi:polyhydroxybutyrate depolymerase